MIHEISYFFATLAQIFAEDTMIFLLLIFIAYIINILVFKVLKLILPLKLENLLNKISAVIFSIIMIFYFLFVIGGIFNIYFYIYSDIYFSIFEKIIIIILVQVIYNFILKLLLLISSFLVIGFERINKFGIEELFEAKSMLGNILAIPFGIYGGLFALLGTSSIMLPFVALIIYFIKSLF